MEQDCICKLISRRKSTGYSLTSSQKVMLEVPSGKILPTLGGRAFFYAASKLWNNLPSEMSSPDSLSNFNCHVKTYFFKQAFNLWQQEPRLWAPGSRVFVSFVLLFITYYHFISFLNLSTCLLIFISSGHNQI